MYKFCPDLARRIQECPVVCCTVYTGIVDTLMIAVSQLVNQPPPPSNYVVPPIYFYFILYTFYTFMFSCF